MFWTMNNKILVNDSGKPISCPSCPCKPSCAALETRGSYHIILTASRLEKNDSVWQAGPGDEEFITREEWGNQVQANAVFEGTLPANGFVMSNNNRWLFLQQGSRPYGKVYEYDKMYWDGGSDETWSKYELYDVEDMVEDGVIKGQCYLIIHCDGYTDYTPKLQVHFGNMTDIWYSDYSSPTPQQIFDGFNILPNSSNYMFDNNNISFVKRAGFDTFIATQAVLSRNVDEMRNNGMTHHVEQNNVTVNFTYIPPSN